MNREIKKETIEKGDRVDIFFSQREAMFNCEVLGTPCAEGDSWKVITKTGDLVYIQRFETMHLKLEA